MTKELKRNNNIDALKFICSLMVIFIHSEYTGVKIYENIAALCRIAVPIFFIISGFFYRRIIDNEKDLKQIKKIIALIISYSIVYYGLNCLLQGYDIFEYFNTFDLKTLIKLLLFNVNPLNAALWYLNAYLYVLIIAYIVKKLGLLDLTSKICPFILIITISICEFPTIFFGKVYANYIYRNFIFFGLPFFFIGYLIRQNKEKLMNLKSTNIWFISVLCIICLFESNIVNSLFSDVGTDLYISTIFLSFYTFLYFLRLNDISNLLCYLGRKHSTNIYLIHPFIRTILKMNKITPILAPLRFVMMLVVSLIISTVVNYLSKEKSFIKVFAFHK